jgi:hypothetical protein
VTYAESQVKACPVHGGGRHKPSSLRRRASVDEAADPQRQPPQSTTVSDQRDRTAGPKGSSAFTKMRMIDWMLWLRRVARDWATGHVENRHVSVAREVDLHALVAEADAHDAAVRAEVGARRDLSVREQEAPRRRPVGQAHGRPDRQTAPRPREGDR